MKYRPDIDGLRAVAVCLVIGFHYFPEIFPGGFIGVDVFFVISGYLISLILYREIENHSFSLSAFYSRRIRRIFPTLSLVLGVSLLVGWFLLYGDEYRELGKYVAAGAGFASNLVLWNSAGYFDNLVDEKPLLHLWSLGVEEQFYIVFPLLLFAAYRRKFSALYGILFATIGSFLANITMQFSDRVGDFYSPMTRFWELAAGSIIAWLIYRTSIQSPAGFVPDGNLVADKNNAGRLIDHPFSLNFFSILGIALLVISCLQIDQSMRYPGYMALIPVLGSALLIYAGPNTYFNRYILSIPVLVWVGLISYPLYLWHWPLFIFSKITIGHDLSALFKSVLIVGSFLMAALTYLLVERPVRSKKSTFVLSLLLQIMIAIGLIGFFIYQKNGFEFRWAALGKSENRFDRPYRQDCQFIMGGEYDDDWCNLGNSSSASPNTAMIGDSFANAYTPMLNRYIANGNNQFGYIQFGRGQCPSLLGYGPKYCQDLVKKSYEYIAGQKDITKVIFSSNWPAYFNGKDFYWINHIESPQAFKEALIRSIDFFQSRGKKVIFLLSPPLGSLPRQCISRPILGVQSGGCDIDIQKARKLDGRYREFMLPLLNSKHVEYFDPFNYLCGEESCAVAKEGRVFYSDSYHLSNFGGEYLADSGAKSLSKIFSSAK